MKKTLKFLSLILAAVMITSCTGQNVVSTETSAPSYAVSSLPTSESTYEKTTHATTPKTTVTCEEQTTTSAESNNTTTPAVTDSSTPVTTVTTTEKTTVTTTEKTTEKTTAKTTSKTTPKTTEKTEEKDTAKTTDKTTAVTAPENNITYTLSNKNADKTTKKVYEYICGLTGNGVLSGQQESTWMGSVDYEMNILKKDTGKLPALRGLDYMNDDFDGVNERAIKWWNEGGLVTICWHTGYDFNGEWNEAMKTKVNNWDDILTDGTAANKKFIEGMDKAAKALLELQNEGVTVIWRPFHEFDGAWFWWGKGGSENFKKLWKMMYTRYTDYWKLNNLIWVLGFSHGDNTDDYGDWYPGDKYCDIVGADSYNGGAQPRLWKRVSLVTSAKPLCFHECGANPTAEQLKKVTWTWFMTWHTTSLTDSNSASSLKSLYNSDYVITRDELPQF